MKYLLLATVLLAVAGIADAAIRTVSWANPTQNVDGSALPASAIARTTVVWGPSATQLTSSKAVAGAATATTLDLAPGTHYVAARTTANGTDSDLSNIVQVVVPQPKPNPPVVTVTEVVAGVRDTPAFRLTAAGGRGSAVVGFVPAGTACEGSQLFTYRGKGYRKVPVTAVKWWATQATDQVVAACA